MRLLLFIYVILVVAAIAVIFTQILLPLVMGRKLFPAFRASRNDLESEIREVEEQLDEKQLKARLDALRAQLNEQPEQPAPATVTVAPTTQVTETTETPAADTTQQQ